MSEMDSGSIVFAGRTGRGGMTSGGEPEGNASGSGAGDVEVGGWKVADAERHGGVRGGGDGGRKTRVSRNFLT